MRPFETGTQGWARFIRWVADSRSHRVWCLVLGIWLLNGFDLTMTLLSHDSGMLDEQNPVAREVLGAGALSVMLYKVGLVLVGSYPLLRFRRARIAELGALVVLVTYAMVAVRWQNCVDVYAMTFDYSASFASIETATASPPQ